MRKHAASTQSGNHSALQNVPAIRWKGLRLGLVRPYWCHMMQPGSRDTATSHVKESSMLEQKLIVLSFGKTRVKVTQHHFEKLLRMHRMSVSPLSRNGASPSTYQTSSTKINRKRSHSTNSQQQFSFLPADMPTPTSHELDIIFAVVLRYNTLVGPQTQGAGFQAALTGECFDTLLVEFGCRMECFESPLNSRYGRFCSAFPAIDRAFGSLGSFSPFSRTWQL